MFFVYEMIFFLSHDFVLFLQNCALSFVFVPFSNSYHLLTFLLCVLMQYKCPFHQTYCPLSQVCPFFAIALVYFPFFPFFSYFSVLLALFVISINTILPFFTLPLSHMCLFLLKMYPFVELLCPFYFLCPLTSSLSTLKRYRSPSFKK